MKNIFLSLLLAIFSCIVYTAEFGQNYQDRDTCTAAADSAFKACLKEAKKELGSLSANPDNYLIREHYLYRLSCGCDLTKISDKESCKKHHK